MTIKEAIQESTEQTSIKHISYDGSWEDLKSELYQLQCEWDYACDLDINHKPVGVIDVWGWTDSTPGNEQDWRLHIHMSA